MAVENKFFEIIRVDSQTILFDGMYISECENVSSSRQIFFTKDYVIKFDRGNRGWSCQCYNEAQMWERVKDSKYSKHFAPVLQAGTIDGIDYVVQKRIYGFDAYSASDKARKKLYEIKDEFDLGDMHGANWCFIRKHIPVIFDYASEAGCRPSNLSYSQVNCEC